MANQDCAAQPLRPDRLEQAAPPRYTDHHIPPDVAGDLQVAYDSSDSDLSTTKKLPLLALVIPAVVGIVAGVGFSLGFWFVTRNPAALAIGVAGSVIIPLGAMAGVEGTLLRWARTNLYGKK